MRKIMIALAAVLLAACPAMAGGLSFDFTKDTSEAGTTERIWGMLYLKDAGPGEERSLYFHVTSPVNQIITYKDKETYVYYPDEKKAIIIVNKQNVSNFVRIDQSHKKADFSAAGFKVVKTEKKSGTVTETWSPKSNFQLPLKKIIIERDGNSRLVRMELRDKSDKIMSMVRYSDYKKVEGKDFAMTVRQYSGGGSGIEETTWLKNVREKAQLPPIIEDFKLPPDTAIQRVEMQ